MLPPETFRIGGWVAGLGRGAVGRLNSVTTFGTRPVDPLEAVETVEHRYRTRGRPVSFRLTELDAELDELLWARGYQKSEEVVVMTTTVHPPVGNSDLSVDGAAVTSLSAVTPRWIDMYLRLSECPDLRAAEIHESLSSLDQRHSLMSIDTKAVVAAVYDTGWVGVFDLTVGTEWRRRGLGRRLTEEALAWGLGCGAEDAYLQVVASNDPATTLYRSLGFAEAYRYWYQIRD